MFLLRPTRFGNAWQNMRHKCHKKLCKKIGNGDKSLLGILLRLDTLLIDKNIN